MAAEAREMAAKGRKRLQKANDTEWPQNGGRIVEEWPQNAAKGFKRPQNGRRLPENGRGMTAE
jgi:hypothetical protein